jgi:hypothetical protein
MTKWFAFQNLPWDIFVRVFQQMSSKKKQRLKGFHFSPQALPLNRNIPERP